MLDLDSQHITACCKGRDGLGIPEVADGLLGCHCCCGLLCWIQELHTDTHVGLAGQQGQQEKGTRGGVSTASSTQLKRDGLEHLERMLEAWGGDHTERVLVLVVLLRCRLPAPQLTE